MEATTNKEVRSNNRKRLVNLLFLNGEMTKQDIVKKLDMSLATVNYLVKELTQNGVLTTGTALNSTGGRKPVCIKPVYDIRYSVGVEAAQDVIRITALDLGNHVLAKASYDLLQENTQAYWEQVGCLIRIFVEENNLSQEKLLDIGITLGITMQDEKPVLRKERDEEFKIDLDIARRGLGMPVHFRNSTKMAAVAELWSKRCDKNFIFVYLGTKISGAVVYDNLVMDFSGINGELGCMFAIGAEQQGQSKQPEQSVQSEQSEQSVQPEQSRRLEQAQRIDDLLSKSVLYKKAGCRSRQEFFDRVAQHDEQCLLIWNSYLDVLAKFLHNILCMFGWKIVLGGSLSPFIEPYIQQLETLIRDAYPFEEFPEHILSVTDLGAYSAATGAAMLPLDKFLEEIAEPGLI